MKEAKIIEERCWITDKYGHAFLIDINHEGHIVYLKRFAGNDPIYILYTLVNQYNSEVLDQYSYMELVHDAFQKQSKSHVYFLNEDDYNAYKEIDTSSIIEYGSKLDFDVYYNDLNERRKLEKTILEQQKGDISGNTKGNEESESDCDDLPF